MRTISHRAAQWCALLTLVSPSARAGTAECDKQYASTFELIQKEIFEKRGCTSSICHGNAATGGLDLREPGAYGHLIDVPTESVSVESIPGLRRVVPGRKDVSLLWLNLAGKTLPELWTAPLNPMPPVGAALTVDELEVIQLWIERGAPREGVVPGTGEILDACLPPPLPLHTEPLPPPAPGTGVQLRAPHQVLPAQTERETCFVSWFDFTDQVPEEFRNPEGTAFRVNYVALRQDPLSHHLVAIAYGGETSVHDPVWGAFTCKSGPRNGDPCDPVVEDACGEGGLCGSEPKPAVACIGFGPGDASIGVGDKALVNSMGSAAAGVPGVYDEVPLRGIVVWNSHAFNVFDRPADLDVWINFEFAQASEQQRKLERFVDISAIFRMAPPAFGADEICQHWVAPPDSELLALSSHTHERGKKFRVFEGKFGCQGGPLDGAPCSPFGPEPGFPVRDLCGGAECTSRVPPGVGDCSGDLEVSIDELVKGVTIALEQAAASVCVRFDGNSDGAVRIDELVAGVDAALNPAWRDPGQSLTYLNLTYADPVVVSMQPPLVMGGVTSVPAERTFTYCALYDNGFTDPAAVKRRSETPSNGIACEPTHCAEGRVGEPCVGEPPEARDRSCDSGGAGDGACDACRAGYGLTTEDEMFVLLGSYVRR